MTSLLRAYLLVEWRIAVNTLKSVRSRDAVEGISRLLGASSQAFAVLMLVPLCVGAAVGGLSAGAYGAVYPAPADEGERFALAFRFSVVLALLVIAAAVIFRLSAGSAPPRARMRLLPISDARLHMIEILASLSDPWLLASGVALVLLPCGMALGGRPDAALLLLPSTLLLVAFLVCYASLLSQIHALVVQSRRARGVALLLLALGSLALALAPLLGRGRRETIAVSTPAWLVASPGEPHVRAVQDALARRRGPALGWTLVLALLAGATFGASRLSFRALAAGSPAAGRPRAARGRGPRLVRGPCSAVADAAIRELLRSSSGRAAFLFNPPFVGVAAVALLNAADHKELGELMTPPVLAVAGALLALQTTLGLQVNQLGSDGAGLTLLLVSPLSDRQIVAGKLLGYGALHLGTAAVYLGPLALFTGSFAPPLWIALVLGIVASYLPAGAAAACISATLPVRADLSKLTTRSAHELAAFASFGLVLASAAPPLGLALFAHLRLGKDWLAPLLVLAWLLVVLLATVPILGLAAELLRARRENLALVAQGR